MADQFNNPANPSAHYLGTGPEIYEQTNGEVNVVVVTLGTTGTAMGILRAMKERNPLIEVVGVEPYPGHKIQGLKNMKESYVPGIFDRYALDRIIHIKDEEAFEMTRRLARQEGIFAGMSSGAAMAAASHIATEREKGIIVTILPDGGDRYLSTNLFTTLLEPDFRFYNLIEREKTDFKPVREGKVHIFVTGPPMDRLLALQDSRRFLISDLLTRFLQAKGFSVNEVILIPDLESRTIQGAMAAKMELSVYTKQQLVDFMSDMDQLGIQRAYRYPRITEHLDAITDFTESLIDKGIAYEKLRSVYFNLSKTNTYGALSRIDPKKIRLGMSVDLDAYEKLNPRDFTLLKRATLAELKRGICMKSDWGNVIPTWHIAAASVGIHELTCPIDIVLSSADFLFPHLENVRSIGEALTGKPFANNWMLCERMWSARGEERKEDELSETMPVRQLVSQGYSHLEIRYWLLSTHYRKPVQVTLENLQNAIRGYHRLREFINRVHLAHGTSGDPKMLPEKLFVLEQQFFDALSDDLNIPRALALLFHFIRQVNPILDRGGFSEAQRRQVLDTLGNLNKVLGVFDLDLQALNSKDESTIRRREEARKGKNWKEADRLRDELLARGIRVIDTPQGTRWERVIKHGGT